jgi:hypothetical protein
MPQQAACIIAAASCAQSTAVGPEIVWTLPKRILKDFCDKVVVALLREFAK